MRLKTAARLSPPSSSALIVPTLRWRSQAQFFMLYSTPVIGRQPQIDKTIERVRARLGIYDGTCLSKCSCNPTPKTIREGPLHQLAGLELTNSWRIQLNPSLSHHDLDDYRRFGRGLSVRLAAEPDNLQVCQSVARVASTPLLKGIISAGSWISWTGCVERHSFGLPRSVHGLGRFAFVPSLELVLRQRAGRVRYCQQTR
ncbi:hypothetical protein BDY21DRAFT_70480 [Lineolata rhizophorae]|uniref:Uncharacterized protein n=1 Tax=Lineolata rhizophorae TaxID=578093 RepID=A0A6A6NV94_9PEZI|nr:hypothetical protein BDY21DRAFT_70480 [Lineolata rhizophorae]